MTLPLAQPGAPASVGEPRAPDARPSRTSRAASLAAYSAAALIALLGLWQAREFYHDDAYITLRYAQRLLGGEGLTWNPGERVEGYSNPLWLFQSAALGALGLDLVDATRVLGVLYLAALFALWQRARAWPAGLLLVASQPGLLLWTRGGLETISFAFWVVASGWLAHAAREHARERDPRAKRSAILAGLALAAAALTRPEGAGVALLGLAWIASARRRAPALAAAAAFGVLAGGYLAFRLLYFGHAVSNPALAKLGGLTLAARLEGGREYLWQYETHWIPILAASLIVLWLARARAAWGLLLLSTPLWALILMAGGDQMLGGRMIVAPVALAAFAAALERPPPTRARRWIATLAVLVATGIQAFDALTPALWKERNPAAAVGEPVGRFLAAELPPGALVALATAGSTPYFAPELRFLDTLGLNDEHIARREVPRGVTRRQEMPGHHKGDGRYVLERQPDLVILGPAQGVVGADPRAWWLTEFELLESPDFRAAYRPYSFTVPVTEVQARWPRVQQLVQEAGLERAFRLIAWVRNDSTAAGELRALGTALRGDERDR